MTEHAENLKLYSSPYMVRVFNITQRFNDIIEDIDCDILKKERYIEAFEIIRKLTSNCVKINDIDEVLEDPKRKFSAKTEIRKIVEHNKRQHVLINAQIDLLINNMQEEIDYQREAQSELRADLEIALEELSESSSSEEE